MANQILSVWGTIGSVVLAIFILLVMITVHEFGHYLAGKILRFKIDEFSIGFGPALFKHKSKKSGEVFALRLIPLGGFCAFAGEDGLDEGKEEGENLPEPFGEEFDAPSERFGQVFLWKNRKPKNCPRKIKPTQTKSVSER